MTGEGGKEEWEAASGVRVCQVVQRVPSQQRKKTLVFPGTSWCQVCHTLPGTLSANSTPALQTDSCFPISQMVILRQRGAVTGSRSCSGSSTEVNRFTIEVDGQTPLGQPPTSASCLHSELPHLPASHWCVDGKTRVQREGPGSRLGKLGARVGTGRRKPHPAQPPVLTRPSLNRSLFFYKMEGNSQLIVEPFLYEMRTYQQGHQC